MSANCRAGNPDWVVWRCRGPFEARCVLISRTWCFNLCHREGSA